MVSRTFKWKTKTHRLFRRREPGYSRRHNLWRSRTIGLFTNNRSFELDDLKVGDAVKPVQLTLDFKKQSGDTTSSDPLFVYVTAVQNDGITEDTFTVTSSDASVVSVEQQGLITITLALPEKRNCFYFWL